MAIMLSRRRKARIAAVIGICALTVVWMGRLGLVGHPADNGRKAYHKQTFTVVKVVDGDTIDIDARDGNRRYTRVRLWGVDTPETKHPVKGVGYYGPQAAEFTREMVLDKPVTIYLEPFERSRDKYGRLLAYVYLADGQMLNSLLIEQGYGYADERFKHIFRTEFQEIQRQARKDKRGLWKAVRPEQWPEWFRKRHDPDYVFDKDAVEQIGIEPAAAGKN